MRGKKLLRRAVKRVSCGVPRDRDDPSEALLGYAQSSCKKLQVRQERCPEIASFRVFGHMISPTVFFVHDFDRFYRFKMAHLSIDGKGRFSRRNAFRGLLIERFVRQWHRSAVEN
jgi:hypothetical protein